MTSSSELAESQSSALGPLTQGSLWRAIWIMSWPLTLTTVASSIGGAVDVCVAGHIGSAAQAAIGLCEQFIFFFKVFIMSVGVGTTAIVSRAYGSGDLGESIKASSQSLVLSGIMGLGMTALSLLSAHYLVPLFSTTPQVMEQAKLMLSIFGFLLIPFSVVSIVVAAFRAIGDAKTPFYVMLVIVGINIVGDYLTVYGNWPMPGLGIRGIVASAIAGSTVGAFIVVYLFARSPLKESLSHLLPLSFSMMNRVVTVGLPSAFQRLSWIAATFGLFFILAHCSSPTQALASWTVGMRVESLVFMPLMALSMAVSSIVGQNLGARQVKRAFQAGWTVAWIGVAMMVVLGACLIIFAKPLAMLMSHDAKAIEYTASYLRINGIGEPFLAIAMILSGALQGAGDTRMPMWISIFTAWFIRLPLAYTLAIVYSMGPTGAWLSMIISIVASCVLNAWRYQSAAWIKAKV